VILYVSRDISLSFIITHIWQTVCIACVFAKTPRHRHRLQPPHTISNSLAAAASARPRRTLQCTIAHTSLVPIACVCMRLTCAVRSRKGRGRRRRRRRRRRIRRNRRRRRRRRRRRKSPPPSTPPPPHIADTHQCIYGHSSLSLPACSPTHHYIAITLSC
jgi:hypothetical protein